MTEVEFTHTTYGKRVVLYAEQVVAVIEELPTMKSVVIIGPGSTAIPVQGTYEEVKQKVTQAKTNAAKAATTKE